MKTNSIKLIAVVIALSCGSVAQAATPKSDVSAALHDVDQAHRDHVKSGYSRATGLAIDAAHSNLRAAQTAAHDAGIAANAAHDAAKTKAHDAALAQAQANLQGAQLTDANQTRTQQQVDAGIGAGLTAANQQRTQQQVDARNAAAIGAALTEANQQRTAAQVNALAQSQEAAAHASRYSSMTRTTITAAKPGDDSSNSTINQAAGSLPANTPVSATINGQTLTTTAGELAKVNPEAQIQTPINSVFAAPARKGGNNHSDRGSRSEHGTGNGGNNAQNSRSAGGLADSHVGGGRAGGGFHY
ncbi:hypothetical protein JNE51_004429 [Salmonella enterica]|nr:hypothetical protein [Salmonella enterica]